VSTKQTAESFWARVDKTKSCWEWQGYVNKFGYGSVAWHGRTYLAHRIAAWLVGMVASPTAPTDTRERAFVLHSCDNPPCCNPEHLFLGNFSDNQLDAYQKNRQEQPRGANHANAKLTWEQVSDIRKRYAAGELQVPLAKTFGVSQRVISLVIRKETYK
jgi:hypothetical protein